MFLEKLLNYTSVSENLYRHSPELPPDNIYGAGHVIPTLCETMLKVVGASWDKIRASTWIIGIVFVFGIIIVILGELGQSDEDGNWAATVYWSKESGFEIVFWGQGKKVDDIPKGAARAYFQSHINTTGWAILDIETQPNYPDWVQAFGAGMLEGSLSWQMIDWQRRNTAREDCEVDEDFCDDLKGYIEENKNWVKEMYKNRSDPYWHQIFLYYRQLEGIQKGFEHGVKRSRAHDVEEMTLEDFLWLNAMTDLNDLKHKFLHSNYKRRSYKSKTRRSINYPPIKQNLNSFGEKSGEHKKYRHWHENLSLASSFVKFLPEDGIIYIAHNSAGEYSSMLKMLKHYNFSYRKSFKDRKTVPGKKITLSSYPGVIHSMDDFYIIRNDDTPEQFVITGISLPIFNDELWDLLSPAGQVFVGPRVMAANRLASNGEEWGSIVSDYNSGTGNKEWIITDLVKYETSVRQKDEKEENRTRHSDDVEGILYVADQVPGDFQMEDMTKDLMSNTYWASYGLPFFETASNLSGVNKLAEVSEVYSYNNTPIAKIFRRDHVKATDMYSVAKLMRSNFYKTDPFSYKNPRWAIGSRGDLANEVQEAAPVGVTDTKIFSSRYKESKPDLNGSGNASEKVPFEISLQIKAGPPYSDSWNVFNRTRDFDDLGPFTWLESKFNEVTHIGHPDIWNFEPIIVF